ncbi:hypothetical protein GOODEAATRI_014476 [Goodea atripinnis]|uniref:PDZ domain-containing protein n=1 Tax=Goodea atripinnis TaxID=208336 RepID=A0ABV0PNK9_9TELE
MIARILAEKDTLRSQLVELQEAVFIFQAKRSPRTQLQRSDRFMLVSFFSRSLETAETDSLLDDYVCLSDAGIEEEQRPRPSFSHGSNSVRTSAPPFLVRTRPKAIRIIGRVLSISLQCETLLSQLTVVGGNKSGVFVHQVTEGSAAHTVGISPGAQIVEVRYEQNSRALKMVLEDSTLEEATWALSQVTGFCHLSLRPRQNGMPYSMETTQARAESRSTSTVHLVFFLSE